MSPGLKGIRTSRARRRSSPVRRAATQKWGPQNPQNDAQGQLSGISRHRGTAEVLQQQQPDTDWGGFSTIARIAPCALKRCRPTQLPVSWALPKTEWVDVQELASTETSQISHSVGEDPEREVSPALGNSFSEERSAALRGFLGFRGLPYSRCRRRDRLDRRAGANPSAAGEILGMVYML